MTHFNTCMSMSDDRERDLVQIVFGFSERKNSKSLEMFSFAQTQGQAAFLCCKKEQSTFLTGLESHSGKILSSCKLGVWSSSISLKHSEEFCCFASPVLHPFCLWAMRWEQSHKERKRPFTQTSISNNLIRGRFFPPQPKRQLFHRLLGRKSSGLIKFTGTSFM